MKKLFIPLATLLLTAVAAMALTWPEGANIAGNTGVDVIPSSTREGDASNILSGTNALGWSSKEPALTENQSFFILDLGATPGDYNTVEISWRDNHPTEFSIYTSDTEFSTTKKTETDKNYSYLLLDAVQPADTTFVGSGKATEDAVEVTSEITLKGTQNNRYLLVKADNWNNWAKSYGIGLKQIKVGLIESRTALDHISISSVEAEEDVPATVEVNAYNKYGEVLDAKGMVDLTLTCSATEVTVVKDKDSDNKFLVTGSKAGSYTLKASCENKGNKYTAEQTFVVNFPWHKTTNVATNKKIVAARVKPDTNIPNPAKNAVDGDTATYYEYNGEWGGGDGYIVVDLGATYQVSAVGVLWNYANGRFFVAYGADKEDLPLPEGDQVYGYNTMASDSMHDKGWTTSADTKRAKLLTTIENPQTARYIMIGDADNPNGKPQIKEIYVAGEKREDEVFTLSIAPVSRYISTDQPVEYNARLTNQYGEEKELPGDVYYTMWGPGKDPESAKGYEFPTKDGKPSNKCGFIYGEEGKKNSELGKYTVKAKCGEYEATDYFYLVTNNGKLDLKNVGELKLGDDSLLTNLNVNEDWNWKIEWEANNPNDLRTLTLTFAYPKTDEGEGDVAAQADEEPQPRTFDLDLITLNWEASAPEEYEVWVTKFDDVSMNDARIKVLAVEGRTFAEGSEYWDNIYNENKLLTTPSENGISFVNVETSSNDLDNVKSIEIKPLKGNDKYRLLLNHLYVRGVDSKTKTPTEVKLVPAMTEDVPVDVYNISGVCVARGLRIAELSDRLPAGLYIAGGKKICIKK